MVGDLLPELSNVILAILLTRATLLCVYMYVCVYNKLVISCLIGNDLHIVTLLDK